ncbi:MAG: UDP-N-acetylglucosamine 1-carboxyvinyltransferase [Bradymonadia bacterium]
MEKFVIEGRHRLNGTVRPNGSKNEALPVLAATLLTEEPMILENVPRIVDVEVMCDVLRALGAQVEWQADNRLYICTKGVSDDALDPDLCRRVRASILFAGPMVARRGHVVLPPPGGDVIGRRRVDTHLQVLEAMGVQTRVDQNYEFRADRLQGADIFLDEASVTATENAIMAASLAHGTTILRNAASEPHVCGLARMLNNMGAHIEGIGTNTLTIHGVPHLKGTTHTIDSDYLEIGSLIGLAAVTNSDLVIEHIRPESLRMILTVFGRLGIEVQIEGNRLRVPPNQSLEVRRDVHNHVPRVDDAPWPAFPTDLMSIAITVATQCKGTVLFFEKMFEGRMFFVDHLQNMGAQIILCDPHRVVVVGPTPLHGGRVESPDVRAGMAMLIAGLCAEGKTTIYNVRQIDRGYERIDEKLRALGAKIERLPVE